MYVMKRTLQTISLLVTMCFAFSSTGFAEEILLQHQTGTNTIEAPADRDAHGDWVHWDTGEIAGGVGLANEGIFTVAAFWEADELEDFDGYEVTRIRIGMWHEATSAAVKIWQGPNAENLTEYVSETAETVEQDWVEVELPEPYAIDTDFQLWIGWDVGDSGDGHFPAGNDGTTDHDGYANMIKMGDDPFVPITDLAEIDGMWSIQAFIAPADNGDDPDDTYTVTLNVDMSGAVAEGDVEFDPEIHHVWVTGSFADWAMPGENADFQMHPADPAKSDDTFYENWDGFDDFTTDLAPWTNIDEHGEPTWGASDFDFEGEAEAFGWRVMNPAETDPDITDNHPAYDGSKYVFSVASNPVPPTGEENKWLISPEIVVTADSELSFAAKSITDQYGLERLRVHVSTTGVDPSDFTQISDGDHVEVPTDWEMYAYDLGDYAGQSIHFAIENVSHDAFMLFIDAIEVTNLGEEDNGEDPEEHIYTITFEATEGDHEYKYFLVEDDPTWDLGEWEGDPNRDLHVDGDMTVNDVFGDPPVSIFEPEVADIVMNIFPNPATTEITVETEEMIEQIRVYDITGREVMQVLVNGNNQTINVSTLREGFYIMQVHTENGVEGRRFHVTR